MVAFWGSAAFAAQWWGSDMRRVIAVLACGFTLAACSASLPSLDFFKPSPAAQTLRMDSKPQGAEAKTSQGQTCRTPCEVTVQTASASNLSVTFALDGYQPQTVPVQPDAAASSGALNPVFAELQTMAPAPRKKKKTAAKKKAAPTTTASAAPAAATSPPPAAAPAPAPAGPAEPAPTFATPYPWPTR